MAPAFSTGESTNQELSAAATTVAFDPPIPLLRFPVPAGLEDDPSRGPFVLAFKDETSWKQARKTCEETLAKQCEAVARRGCSLRAANACKPPWWKSLLLAKAKYDPKEREACEERVMMACLASSIEEGTRFAKETCEKVFAGMRIAQGDQVIDPQAVP